MAQTDRFAAGAAASAILALAGCADLEQARAEYNRRQFQIVTTRPTCDSPQVCERMWAAANQWVTQWAGMKIQVATEYLLETYNSTGTALAARVEKRPAGETGYEFWVEAWCASGGCNPNAQSAMQAFNDRLNGLAPKPPEAAQE